MTADKPIKFRAHHLADLGSLLFGEPLTPKTDFEVKAQKILEQLLTLKKGKIQVVEAEPDAICKLCKSYDRQKHYCFKKDPEPKSISLVYDWPSDKIVAKILSLKLGSSYTLKKIKEILYNHKDAIESWRFQKLYPAGFDD